MNCTLCSKPTYKNSGVHRKCVSLVRFELMLMRYQMIKAWRDSGLEIYEMNELMVWTNSRRSKLSPSGYLHTVI